MGAGTTCRFRLLKVMVVVMAMALCGARHLTSKSYALPPSSLS
jgi:hypothetical protein